MTDQTQETVSTSADTSTTQAPAPVASTPAPAKPKRASKPATGKAAKRAAKASGKAAKPAKPADKAQAAKREAAQREADAMRATAARFYAGASLAAHKSRAAPRDLYVARALDPVQKPANGVASTRDESGLALILSKAKGGTFDPCALNFDVGILSRLAALKFISYAAESDTFSLTKAGAERARVVVKRAA